MYHLFFFSLFLIFCSWIIPGNSKIENYTIPEEKKEIKKLVELIIQWSEVNIKMGKKRNHQYLKLVSYYLIKFLNLLLHS
jgi:hypothetical protein